MLSEASIIAQLKKAFPTHIGDDAAVLPPSSLNTLISKDILVEHKHFNTNYVDPASLAHKALHVNLSDLAAMGGTPRYALLGIAIPSRLSEYANAFISHFTACCKRAQITLIGGDTTASTHDLFISVTVLGEATASHIKHRDTAKANDLICITGPLGLAHLGLVAFETNQDGFATEKEHLLRPNAKIQEGLWLAKQTGVNSMMDISDGLYIDLKRLCEASHVGAKLQLDTLPCSPSFISACTTLNLDPRQVLLTGGEDYGLLLTVDSNHYAALAGSFLQAFHTPLIQIGSLTPEAGICLLDKTQPVTLTLTPFNHFGESL